MRMLLVNIAIVLATAAAMEGVAYLTHRYIMHGPLGWGWHKSHHEPHDDALERNDLFGIVFAALSILLIALGTFAGLWPLREIGLGMTIYGILYYVAHDGLVHHRWPFRIVPRHPFLKRLVQAHRLHHAVHGRDGCVSFGFLYTPPVASLKADLKARQTLAAGRAVRRAGPS